MLVHVITCTRGRSRDLSRLARCLARLHQSLTPEVRLAWLVVDDSIDSVCDELHLRSTCDRVGVELTLLSRKSMLTLHRVQRFQTATGELADMLRSPGEQRQWDAGGIRNFASAWLAQTTPREAVVCLIDDDVVPHRDELSQIRGGIAVDRLMRRSSTPGDFANALRAVNEGAYQALGAQFIGVADLSLVDHLVCALSAVVEGSASTQLWTSPSLAKSQLQPWPLVIEHGDGCWKQPETALSTGLIITTVGALACAPFPRMYNEDWFWSCGIQEHGSGRQDRPLVVAHLPSGAHCPIPEFIAYQEFGDAVWQAYRLRRVLGEGPRSDAADETSIKSILKSRIQRIDSLIVECGKSNCVPWDNSRVIGTLEQARRHLAARVSVESLDVVRDLTQQRVRWSKVFESSIVPSYCTTAIEE